MGWNSSNRYSAGEYLNLKVFQESKMEIIKRLGMKRQWIYEVIVSTGGQGFSHAAPIGVWTQDFNSLKSEIYKGSKTLKNILENRDYSVNFPPDTIAIYTVLFAKSRLVYEASKKIGAPRLHGASASLELQLKTIKERGKSVLVEGEIVSASMKSKINLINRAEGLVLENLVLSTKLPHLPGQRIQNLIKENYRVIRKVAPGSDYEKIVESLMETLKL